MTDAEKDLRIATLVILLQEARNALNAMFILLAKSDKKDEAFKKFGHLGMKINSALKSRRVRPPLTRLRKPQNERAGFGPSASTKGIKT